MTRPTRTTLSRSVSDALLARIRDGEFQPDDKLPTVAALMEEFGVGRNTIREAMQALVVMGLVEVRPRVGATVRAATATEAATAISLSAVLDTRMLPELYEFRRAVEVEAAALAAERATPAEVRQIEEYANRYEFATAHGLHSYEDDLALHRAIATASHNEFFLKVLRDVADLLAVARRHTEQVPGASERAAVEHTQIAAAIKAGDAERAKSAMHTHIESAIWAARQLLDPDARSAH